MQEETPTEFVPEPYKSDHLDTLERWRQHEYVSLTAMMQFKLCEVLGKDPNEYEGQEDAEPFCGDIEPARCLPMGTRLYHSDMGWPCETWTILDPIPSVCARPGDTLYQCPGGPSGRRDGGLDAWPTEWAIMYRDDSTYVAFLTDEHVKALYFPAGTRGGAKLGPRSSVSEPIEASSDEGALFDLITDSGGRMPAEGEEVAP